MWSCDLEKLSIPPETHPKAQSSKNVLFSAKKLKELYFFYLLANPAEIAYFSVRDGKLSNNVRLVEFWPRKVAVHTFLGVVPSWAAQTAFAPELSKAISLLS